MRWPDEFLVQDNIYSNRDLLRLKTFDWCLLKYSDKKKRCQMSHNFLLRLFIRAPDERFWDPGFKFVHSVYTIFALFFVSTDLLQLAYTCQFFSLCPTLDTSGVFRQYPHCLPVCVVFVHLSVDILLIVGQFYNIEKRNRLHSATIQSNEISITYS